MNKVSRKLYTKHSLDDANAQYKKLKTQSAKSQKASMKNNKQYNEYKNIELKIQ